MAFSRRTLTQRAFSLVEIMIVVIIMGILISFAVQNFIGVGDDARTVKARKDADSIANAAREFYTQNGKPPVDVRDLNLSNIPATPSGGAFTIQDPFIVYEQPKGNTISVKYRSIGKLLFVDLANHLRISTEVSSRGVDTMKQPESGCQPRFSPNGTMICATESGGKLVVYDISGFDLEKPNSADIAVIAPQSGSLKGKNPAWLSDTTVVYTAKYTTITPADDAFWVYSFDIDSPDEKPTKLFKVGALEPLYLDAAESGIVGLHDGTNIDIYDISGNYVNQIKADSSAFTFSRDGSKIVFQKGGQVHVCSIDESAPKSTGLSGKNPCFSPDTSIVAYEVATGVAFASYKNGSWEPNAGFAVVQSSSSPSWSR